MIKIAEHTCNDDAREQQMAEEGSEEPRDRTVLFAPRRLLHRGGGRRASIGATLIGATRRCVRFARRHVVSHRTCGVSCIQLGGRGTVCAAYGPAPCVAAGIGCQPDGAVWPGGGG